MNSLEGAIAIVKQLGERIKTVDERMGDDQPDNVAQFSGMDEEQSKQPQDNICSVVS